MRSDALGRRTEIARSGSYNFFYFHDGNKNVSDIVSYQSARGVPAHYEYAPFGAVTAATTNTSLNRPNENYMIYMAQALLGKLCTGYDVKDWHPSIKDPK